MSQIDMAQYMRNRRLNRRNELIEILGSKCVRCGATEQLEFNHIDPNKKLITLSGKGLDTAWIKILAELDKCELVCKNCHKIETLKQWQSGIIIQKGGNAPILEYAHGTSGRYNRDGCRCEHCREAKRQSRTGLTKNNQIVEFNGY